MLVISLQYFAHKKGGGSTKNGRDSESKRLGVKRADGQFVLAGNILVRNQNIVGLTTAADIWVTAAIGMVIGSGMYELGIYGSVMTLLVLEVFHQLTFRLMNKNYHLQLTLLNGNTVSMLDWFKQQKIKTDLVSLQENEDHEVVAIDIQLHATTSIEDLLRLLKGMAGVKGVSIS